MLNIEIFLVFKAHKIARAQYFFFLSRESFFLKAYNRYDLKVLYSYIQSSGPDRGKSRYELLRHHFLNAFCTSFDVPSTGPTTTYRTSSVVVGGPFVLLTSKYYNFPNIPFSNLELRCLRHSNYSLELEFQDRSS